MSYLGKITYFGETNGIKGIKYIVIANNYKYYFDDNGLYGGTEKCGDLEYEIIYDYKLRNMMLSDIDTSKC